MAMVHALLMLMFLFFNVKQSVCEPRTTEAAPLICSNRIAPTSVRQIFVANFLAAMDSLTQQVSRQKYGVAVNGTGNNTVYAFGECMKDLSQNDCNLCFAEIKTRIIRCFPFQRLIKGGRLFYDGCYIRYDDYMFFNESLSFSDRVVCGVSDFGGNQGLFKVGVGNLVKNMSFEGPKNDGFFTGFLNNGNLTVYGLAQCWEVVNGSGCRNCLEKSVLNLSSCTPKTEGRVLNAGCYLRYSTTRFYNNSGNDESNGSGGSSRRQTTILASISGAVAFLLSVATVSFFFRKKMLQQRRVKKQLGPLWGTVIKSKLNFSYETLERATNYFHESNKLGQGGSGSVYKGILPGGQMVAVKRLFFNTTQWVDHFFNEVNLISGIEHKNLVKLLGCSITGPESLLVYEYVPNQSLHDYLFVRKDVPRLSWEEQYRIVLGIAEGLAYLHEESKLRIIHRDIKLSNVLLDKDLMPKIADFGLARLFPEDETHISTAIAGTLGYIAPEYMVRGKLTEKVDVYSFGVLVIEFVCGKKNYSSQNSHSILQKVWKLYEAEKLSEAVHHSLENKFHEEEVLKVLQIGLICVQASAELRPSMSIVVKMLTENHGIPRPTQPPFLNPSNAEVSPSNQPGVYFSQSDANTQCSVNETTDSLVMPR